MKESNSNTGFTSLRKSKLQNRPVNQSLAQSGWKISDGLRCRGGGRCRRGRGRGRTKGGRLEKLTARVRGVRRRGGRPSPRVHQWCLPRWRARGRRREV